MKVLLLLAGQSTRFWPLHDKALFPVCGKTILEHQLDLLRAAGLKDIVLVGGKHNRTQIQSLLPKLPFIEQKNLNLGMQGALLSALPHITKGPVMVVSGNDMIDAEGYTALLATAAKKGADGVILAKKVTRYFPGGYLVCKGSLITHIVEKPGEGNEPSNLVNIVAHIHHNSHTLLTILKKTKGSRDDGYEVALSTLFKTHQYLAVPYKGFWQPIKYPWHLLDLLPHLLMTTRISRIHNTTVIHPTAVIEGNVVLEKDVRVLAHASIIGPCTIGRGTIVANNALIRSSSTGEQCVIGYGTEVARSVLHHNVWTHKNYIGDSVIGENVAFGAGTVLGNFRLDEETIFSRVRGERICTHREKLGAMVGSGSRIGIQVGVNPGIKIGSGTFISGGGFIEEDIGDALFVTWKKGGMVLIKNKVRCPKKGGSG